VGGGRVIDLSPARSAVEQLMGDTITIVRPSTDLVLDPDTHALVPPGGDPTIYGAASLGTGARPLLGMAAIKARASTEPRITDSAGRNIVGRPYVVKIPWDAAVPEPGDIVTVATSQTDPAMAGLQLTVIESVLTTILVQRKLLCVQAAPAASI